MGDDFGVGFGTEDMTTLFELPPKLEKVFDYSVVDYGDLFVAVCVWVSVYLRGRSVSCPSGVAYANSA